MTLERDFWIGGKLTLSLPLPSLKILSVRYTNELIQV